MLFYKDNKDPAKAAALRKLVEYCLAEGQKTSIQMGYIPLPDNVAGVVRQASANIK
jgi:phosphate transport system substrate-binding protein